MIVVALGWLAIVILGALPFYVSALLGHNLSETTHVFSQPLHALFEAMSGFTSTGLSMTQDASNLPYSLQWWRSFSEWIGGAGVIVLALALIEPSEENYALYAAEARTRHLGDTIKETVRRICILFFAYTGLGILAFWLAGMSPWEAVNHGLTGIATGGFSVTSDSIQIYDSTIKWVAIVIMLLGAVSFNLHHLILARRDVRAALQQSQLWTFVVMLVLGLLGLALITVVKDDSVALIDRAFQWASAFGTCGFGSVQVGSWTQSALMLLTVGMIGGGMGGSTTGGLKLNRVT
jgi:trk system potassium uptake protein TrkH